MSSKGGKDFQRFVRWQERASPKTRDLASQLLDRWAPTILARGFEPVGCILGDKASPVESRELRFERRAGEYIDVVHVFFDKYASPRFQISFARRDSTNPHRIVRASHLVKRPKEHYHEWGKPRWLPLALWSSRQSAAAIDSVIRATNQIFAFLETGDVGLNVGRE